MAANREIVIDNDFPSYSIKMQPNHIFPIRIVNRIPIPTLRVNDVCDEFLVETPLVLSSNGQACDKTTVRYDCLFYVKTVYIFNHFRIRTDFIGSAPFGKGFYLFRRHGELSVLVGKWDEISELLLEIPRHEWDVFPPID